MLFLLKVVHQNKLMQNHIENSLVEREATLALHRLKYATTAILHCESDYKQMKESVDLMYQIFSSITGVTINALSQDKDIYLSQGKAISTSAAAHCLLEMKRTALFLRGINKAIRQKRAELLDRPIKILYAGTGPYGTLITPLLTLYKPNEICVDLLDINANSLEALKKINDNLGLSEFIDKTFCTDATTFKVNTPYDIVISETMLACLKNEPQVAIMQNLIPQLTDDSIFIPEMITIDALLTNPKMEMERLELHEKETPHFERRPLGNLFTLSKKNLDSIYYKRSFSIPSEAASTFPVLKLFTTVTVFDDEILSDNDSSITLPKQFYDFRKINSQEVKFWYVQGRTPRIESRTMDRRDLNLESKTY